MANLCSPAFAFSIMDGINKAGVVPILDHIVWAIMNLNFNGLAEIDLPGDHFSPGGAYFVDDVTEEALVSVSGEYALTNAPGAGVTFAWDRFERMSTLVYEQPFA